MSPSCERVAIDLGERSYSILIGAGLLDQPASWSDAPRSAQALIVTNTTVAPLYAQRLQRAIASLHAQVRVVELPDGE
jgi:3-dehydroquinate synthase